jgi:hypothetical protein
MQVFESRWRPFVSGVLVAAVALALAACAKKSDPTVSTGGGASSQSRFSVKGAAR